MITIKPFRAVRPVPKFADKVAALPYDVMSSAEAREMVKGNPCSFLHIDKAEIDLDAGIDPHDDSVYRRAKTNLMKMLSDGVMLKDGEPCLYIYRLIMNGRVQTGLVACTSIEEYLEGKIKKHELTLEAKEQDRIKHVDETNANTGPIYLAYKTNKSAISKILADYAASNAAIYSFVSEDGITHEAWVINDRSVVESLVSEFENVDALYIADGHHRNASAVKVGLSRRQKNPAHSGKEEYNYYLSVIFPDDELYIMDYNRVVSDLNGMSNEEFLHKLSEKFNVSELKKPNRPMKQHSFSLYLGNGLNKWYSIEAKSEVIIDDPIKSLDVSILQNEVLTPLLNIGDPRTDKRIDFVGGARGIEGLEKRVNSGEMALAFAMFPTSMDELMRVADSGLIMPPKSTWFEPKLRSGLFIHELLDVD